MNATIAQELVKLRCADNLVSFSWPLGAEVVTISATEGKHQEPTAYSPEEASELFHWLLRHGAY
jgi:hypothetical protein